MKHLMLDFADLDNITACLEYGVNGYIQCAFIARI
jgi:hypothetical protein